jgi:putative hydrolase of the HAD superfamily
MSRKPAAGYIEFPSQFFYTKLGKSNIGCLSGKMMSNNIKAVLFDVDDTLFDRKLAQKKVCTLIAKQLPQIFDAFAPERILEAFLESDQISTDIFNSGAPSEGLRDKRTSLFLQLLDIHENYIPAVTGLYVQDYPLVDAAMAGAIPVVKNLSRKFRVGVISNGFPDVQYRKLETMGLYDLFSCIVLSEVIGIRKPDAAIFQKAASLIHLKPADCLYVGDSYTNDVIGAKNAGMQACWLNPESLKPQNETIKADLIINELAELPALLRKYEPT